jgi:hypothetical protein
VAKVKSPITELKFPWGGLNRRAAFDQQPPYSSPYCFNVRPFDVVGLNAANPAMHGGRQRGGARPGTGKMFSQQLGGGSQIQFIDYCSQTAGNLAISNVLLAISDGQLYSNSVSSGAMATVGSAIFNATGQLRGAQVGLLYYIADYRSTNFYSESTGTINSGGVTLTDSALTGYSMTAGDVIWIDPADATQENIFPVSSFNSGSNTITFGTNSGANPLTPQSDVTWQVNKQIKTYTPSANSVAGTFPLPIPATNYDIGTVTVTAGVATLAGSGASWSGVPAPTAANSLTLTIPNASGIGTQSYLVAALNSSTELTLIDTTTDANMPAGTTYLLSWVGTYFGVPPIGCTLCINYRGRLFLAGGAWSNLWYASRQLNPYDWDYGYDPADPGRAIAGEDATTGGPTEPLTALISISDNYLIMACERSLWLMVGDPAYGGQITPMSHDIGVLGPTAWCTLPDGSVVILSRDGLYLIAAGLQSPPEPISRPNLPAELLDLDWTQNYINLAYDVGARGIHLSVTPIS